MERISRNTRSPNKLRAILEAMNGDVFLFMETLVRSTLVTRLSDNFFAYDQSIHAASGAQARSYREALRNGEALRAPLTFESEIRRGGSAGSWGRGGPAEWGLQELDDDEFARHVARLPSRNGGLGPVVEGRDFFSFEQLVGRSVDRIRVRTYIFPKISWDEWWSGVNGVRIPDVPTVAEPGAAAEALRTLTEPGFCDDDDVWSAGGLDDPPAPRTGHSILWTGNEVIVWGGNPASGNSSGARYDPLTDTWSSTSVIGAPAPRGLHSAVWTGAEMIIWGGTQGGDNSSELFQDGALYNPLTNTWRPMSLVAAPTARYRHSTVWTGTEMIVYGGWDAKLGLSNTGGRYAPSTNSWRPIPSWEVRSRHTAVWTGSAMIVVGGHNATAAPTSAALYMPANDGWTAIAPVPGTEGPNLHTAVWGAERMMIWGGLNGHRLLYNPASNSWSYMSYIGAPEPRRRHTALWTGSKMMVWGGMLNTGGTLNTGVLYDPIADAWSPISTVNAPTPRNDAPAVWTGSLAIIWGGEYGTGVSLASGARYDPSLDAWTPTSMGGNPSPRQRHAALWTGNEMMVWGGQGYSSEGAGFGPLQTGGLYDPALDRWRPIALTGAPDARSGPSMVWTGQEAIVWGGSLSSGGRYDPLTDTWSPTSIVGAPQGRRYNGATWTGDELIVWGGMAVWPNPLSDGAKYDPVLDRWSPMTNVGAPSARSSPAFVWTGSRVIVWAGDDVYSQRSGALYDPVANVWTPMSTAGAPLAELPSAVWTGTEMIVIGGSNEPFRGGRYRPDTDTWTPVSLQDAYWGAAIWADDEMLVWSRITGGGSGAYYAPLTDTWSLVSRQGVPPYSDYGSMVWTGNTVIIWGDSGGGRLHLAASPDDDMDGQRVCRGDCEDTSVAVSAGAAQICGDGLNNDCLSPGWPSLAMTNEMDDDGDTLSECDGDCDDDHALVRPGGPQFCGDRLNNDCIDPSWPAVPPEDMDQDADGAAVCQADCDDSDPLRYPGSPEINDGLDNQCPGEPGHGLVDEVGDVWFNSQILPALCWSAQELAASYERLRADDPRLTIGCMLSTVAFPACWSDSDLPAVGGVFYYLVRPLTPYAGSWGSGSDGVEREFGCTSGFCGDGVRNGNELCDGSDVGDESCVTQGYDSGTLRCNASCSGYDTSGCRF